MADEEKSNTSWLTSAAPIAGGVIDMISGIGNSLFGANQARKNRAFQERMYQRQLEDNRENWNMMNAYNHPLAVRQRMESAGLNPLLMYGNGGSSLQVANTAQGASAPSGAQSSGTMQTQFAQAAAQSALINAQIRNIDADTENKKQQTDESWTHTDWYRSTKGIQYSIMKRNDAMLRFQITQIATATNSLASMTWKELEVMDKGMEMLDKNYELSERDLNNRIAYNIAQIALGNRQVDAQLKQISVNMYDAITRRQVSIAEIGKAIAETKKIISDTELNEYEKQAKINDIIHGKLANILYAGTGTDQLPSVAGVMLLLSGQLSGRFDVDRQELKDMYKQYGIEF